MRYLLRFFFPALVAVFSAAAQDTIKAEPTELTIRSYTKLVQVPVIVRDKSGKPVRGLTKDDFHLYENGKPVKISSFQASSSREEQAKALVAEEKLPAGEYTNVAQGRPVERPVVILLIDATNIDFLDQAQARQQLVKFLSEKIDPGTLMSLMVMNRSGIYVIHEYSTDPQVLINALKRVRVASASTGNISDEAARTAAELALNPNDTAAREAAMLSDFITGGTEFQSLRRAAYTAQNLRTLNFVAAKFANVPGRKALLWIASSFPYFGDDLTSINSSDRRGRFIQTIDRLNDANVALYPVDARGLLGFSPPTMNAGVQSSGMIARNPGGTSSMGSTGVLGGFGDTSLGMMSASRPIDNMKVVAELTGGIPFYGTNDLAGAMRKATDDSEDYYMLGYYLKGGKVAKAERRSLKVVVSRKDVTVRSRSKLFWMPESGDPRSEVIMALQTPLEHTAIPLKVKMDRRKTEDPVHFEIQVSPQVLELMEPENTISLNLVVEARNASGAVVDRIDQTLSGKISNVIGFRSKPLLYSNNLKRLADAATVRFIVRDNNSGKMGSIIVENKN